MKRFYENDWSLVEAIIRCYVPLEFLTTDYFVSGIFITFNLDSFMLPSFSLCIIWSMLSKIGSEDRMLSLFLIINPWRRSSYET